MIQAIHILIEHGVFKSMLSSDEKNKKIMKEKENYSYARLVRKEDYKIEGVSSDIGLALMSSLEGKGNGYSVFFVNDEDVLDFLFFDNIIILKTSSHLYSYDWKNEKLLFKRHIQIGLSIDLVEPSMIIQTSRLNSLMIDPYKGQVLSKINGNGRFIDASYDNGKTVIVSIVEDNTDVHNPKNFLHFSFYKHDKNKLRGMELEYQFPFPYEELEYHQRTHESTYESYYEVLENHRNTDKKLRAFYEKEEKKSLRVKISMLQDKENVMRIQGQTEEAEKAKTERTKLLNEKNRIEDRYKEEWFYNDGMKNIVRIIGLSSKENVFYFSFTNVFFSMDMDKKEWKNMGYIDSNISLVKVIPSVMKGGGETSEDVLLFRRTLHSQKQYHFEAIEISRINENGLESYPCSKMNYNNFIAELEMKDVKDCFFQYKNHFVQPREMTIYPGTNSSWIQSRYFFVNTEFFPNTFYHEKELFRFFKNDFSILEIGNNRLINVAPIEPSKIGVKELNEDEKNNEDATPTEKELIAIREEVISSLSIYNVPFINDEDKEIIRKLREQPDWILQTFKPEREMISVIIPDMIRKYKETNEQIYLDSINEILKLLKEIAEKKELAKAEMNHLDAKFAVEYAQSLMNTE